MALSRQRLRRIAKWAGLLITGLSVWFMVLDWMGICLRAHYRTRWGFSAVSIESGSLLLELTIRDSYQGTDLRHEVSVELCDRHGRMHWWTWLASPGSLMVPVWFVSLAVGAPTA